MEQEYSKETLEILGKTPNRLIRYGLLIFFIIVVGFLLGLNILHYQESYKSEIVINETSHLNYIAHMQVNIADIKKFEIGSTVIIKLNQYPKNIYGVLSGHVDQISLNKEKQVCDIYILLSNGLETNFNKKLHFLSNMSGIGIIKGERKSVFEWIFSSALSDNKI